MLPLQAGWDRQLRRGVAALATVIYIAPCGRKLRDMTEIRRYLGLTGQLLGPDCFTFCPEVRVSARWRSAASSVVVEDISQGVEAVAVQAVNSVDGERPELADYRRASAPQGGVEIAADPGFLICCDCVDDCAEQTSCACRQLTVRSTCGDFDGEVVGDAGYKDRRLYTQVVTGIYECNSQCSCSALCHNRVAQQPLSCHLQLFRTKQKGWGVRTLTDLPQGTFVCVFVGSLYGPEEGNAMGSSFGDEYFAALDLIEVIEKRKEGYERDVSDMSCSSTSSSSSSSSTSSSSSSLCRPAGRLTPHKEPRAEEAAREKVSVRELLGDAREEPYIVDARVMGNIGKFFNHSCDPNVFVQNVFVDSHDLRFPWLGFFTYRRVGAGEELAWDYCYEVGAVPGKRIDCHCGAEECRKRLL